MNFSKALEALKEGKKITNKCLKPGWLEIRKIQCGTQGEYMHRIVSCYGDSWCYSEFVDSSILAEDWEIMEGIHNYEKWLKGVIICLDQDIKEYLTAGDYQNAAEFSVRKSVFENCLDVFIKINSEGK